ncbi:MAG: hypothetical protein N3A38_17255 [Planctomycetota bacterium]|nr:hypothetical protein [Planctomycetota bacterium]
MALAEDLIILKLGEFKSRHTGKAPFGPVDDLVEFYDSLDESNRKIMNEILVALETDSFWGDFIKLFRTKRPTQ